MRDAMAVRAKNHSVLDSMLAALGLRFAMVRVAPRLIPAATHALIAVVSYDCLGPRSTRPVTVLTFADSVAFTFIPSAVAQ